MDLTLIIFAALALFLTYRLFSVLGTRGGHEPEEHERPVLRPVESGDVANDMGEPVAEPERKEPLPSWAEPLAAHQRRFDPAEFLDGAAKAYEMVVQAYATGDLSSVRSFVDAEVLKSFEVAIEGRRSAGQSVDLTFVGVETPDVIRTAEESDHLVAELRFRSEQVRVVRGADGEVAEGDPEKVVTVIDEWVFTRPKRTNDPNWTLVATHGSGEA